LRLVGLSEPNYSLRKKQNQSPAYPHIYFPKDALGCEDWNPARIVIIKGINYPQDFMSTLYSWSTIKVTERGFYKTTDPENDIIMRMSEIRSQTENHGTMDQSLNKKTYFALYKYICIIQCINNFRENL